MSKQEFGTPFSRTATGATGAHATASGSVGVRYFITDINVTADSATALWTVQSGATILWQGAGSASQSFGNPLTCDSGATASVNSLGVSTVSAANMGGFSNNS